MTRRRPRGFTLIEMVVTLGLLALIASIVAPLAEVAVKRAREHELREALRQIRNALDAYKQAFDDGRMQKKVGESGYPRALEVLVDGIEDIRRPGKGKIYFLRRIPRDPFHPDPLAAPQDTWGKRSFASPPDEPQEGDDVFDVYSVASGKGLDGRPYRDW